MRNNGSDSTGTSSLRFPTGRYPTGWFQVGWSDDVERGSVHQLRFFAEDLVMWRSESGVVSVSDAYCLHLGANLAVRGRVEGEELVCPWHGWHWNAEGRNTLIPFSEQTCKPKLQMKVWPAREWYGRIVVWHDLDGHPPSWELPPIPRLDSGTCRPFSSTSWTIKAHVQNVVDNIADPNHFVFVHGSDAPPTLSDYKFDGPLWTAKSTQVFGGGKGSTWLTPGGATTVESDFFTYGLGVMGVCNPDLLGGGVYLGGTTPIDETYCEHWFSFTTALDVPEEKHEQLVKLQERVTQMDFFTWENMKPLDAPNLTPEEAQYLYEVRRWGRQFYPEYADKRTPVDLRVAR